MATRKTLIGSVDSDVLAFSSGKDPLLDRALVEADCLGSAAHVAMLAAIPMKKRLFARREFARVHAELARIARGARRGSFHIRPEDQDVHLAVERLLTRQLGELGKRVHTGRSRNDQIAVDLRIYARDRLLDRTEETLALADALLALARRHAALPMVGRTHMQPAMPSSVGLWAASHAEALLDDTTLLRAAYEFNLRCPLGSAAGYGVALPLDRNLTARLLGFSEPIANALYASSARGKCEAVILSSLSHLMLSLSRLAQDLILYSMPEFAYFRLPDLFGTGSSLMPQKNNPDPLELIRAKSHKVLGMAASAAHIVSGLPAGYNRDLQEIKELFFDGLQTTGASLRILRRLILRLRVDPAALRRAFTPGVFAADRALERVAAGEPFRDAYASVKAHLDQLGQSDPDRALRSRAALRDPGIRAVARRIAAERRSLRREQARSQRVWRALLGIQTPREAGAGGLP